jgi:C1A family cysteine protease
MNGKQIAVLIALIGAAAVLLGHQQASQVSSFESWKARHGISFSNQFENAYREKVFLANLAEIEAHNSRNDQTYTMGLNQFSAMTQEEFAETYLTLQVPESTNAVQHTDEDVSFIGDVDWVSRGAVTGVKNQGQCGSCWAFSATGGLEGLSKLSYENLQSFSEQQLVDCSGSYGNQACNGGLMNNAFKFVKDHGIVLESEYPYKAVKQTCSKTSGSFKISGYTEVSNPNALTNAISGRPVSVAVDATNWSKYSSGVFSNCKTSLNHGVTLVGISGENWVVKNSWGTTWGEKGFIRLAKGNTCGIANAASYPNK